MKPHIEIKADLKSIQDMRKTLNKINKSVGARVTRAAVKAGADVMVPGLKNAAGKVNKTGRLRDNLAHKIITRSRAGSQLHRAYIGAKWIEGPNNPAIYSLVLETGGNQKDKNKNRINPFARDGWKSTTPRARQALIDKMRAGFEKAVAGAR